MDTVHRSMEAMGALESGAIANPDEGRQVGHYWLRNPDLAPTAAIRDQIRTTTQRIDALTPGDHNAILLIGVGGSALGPQMAYKWLQPASSTLTLYCLDNTDAEGFVDTLTHIDPQRTLAVVITKSGGTTETMNGLAAARAHWAAAHEPFAAHAIAITGPGSSLDAIAKEEEWLHRLPIWDWVGGRTSITSAVGLVPMHLLGFDTHAFLDGAAAMDKATRQEPNSNPALQLAAAWFSAGNGLGERNLVIEPYRDRLSLLGRYLQQLVMESIGKAKDRAGNIVHQGLGVFGNKGSTDQHAFMQQIRDGKDDALVHFIESIETGLPNGADPHLIEATDHLFGFWVGTRDALTQAGRPSVTIRLDRVDARTMGAVVALFERAVGFYAEWANINAYNQPGVEAGKIAAQNTVRAIPLVIKTLSQTPHSAQQIGQHIAITEELVWRICMHLCATNRALRTPGSTSLEDKFCRIKLDT